MTAIERTFTVLAQPIAIGGKVIHGFGRGSKQLGFATANLPDESIAGVISQISRGIYCGFASVGPVSEQTAAYPMVMSVGWNPQFNNDQSRLFVESHILHKFEHDFYGQEMRLLVVARIRDEAKFESVDGLIKAIHDDIELAKQGLQDPALAQLSKKISHSNL
eukprot:c12744_g1_i1.p2 GENE.c12744_g1_i1~~c12744_g1_i1.p2  ORF type:complete len:163 (-),score=39.13 c12744_g1_i1:171-659(-)